jgi:HlyD family secretion protein
MKRSRVVVWFGAGTLLIAAAGAFLLASSKRLPSRNDDIPYAVVKQGQINLQVHATGQLQASHAVMLTAPAVGGDSLQITHLVRSGDLVKKGETIIEFDPSEQHYKLEQNRSELLQAEQEIIKANADAAVLSAQDKVELLKAGYDVRRAELEVQKNELVSKIDADKNILALQQAKRVLTELKKDIQSHAQSGKASIYLAQEKWNKAKLAMDQAQENLDKMQVIAPMDGLVSIQKNMNAAGGFFFTGMSLPDFHPGDQAQPGSPIAQLVDPMEMDLVAQVGEQDHGNVQSGQPVEVSFYALPGSSLRGIVKSVSGMTMRQFFESNSGGKFDVSIQLAKTDARLRPGMTAQILFLGDQARSVLYLPRQALFLKDGKHIVYVKNANGYEQREVKINAENESRAALQGLAAGTEVALIDPTVPRKAAAGPSSGASSGGTP